MMRRIILIAVLACLASLAWSQTAEQKAQAIKNDESYIYGDGYGGSFEEADKNAMAALINNIAVSISSSLEEIIDEVNTNGEITSETKVRMVVNTYAQGTLTNTQSMLLGEEPETHVMRYMKRSELDTLFEHRREKVMDMIHCAQRAEQKLRIDDALRYYYWSFTLLKSLQYPNKVTFKDKGENRRLMVWLPEQINTILGNLQAQVTDTRDNHATLYFTYNGKPVQSLDFTFWGGNSWSMLNSAKNGMAEIELRPGTNARSLNVNYEYEYTGEAQIDPELQSVARVFKGTAFPKAEVRLGTGNKPKIQSDTLLISQIPNQKQYNKAITSVMSAIQKNDYASIKFLFTDEGWDMMNRLLHYGRARMLGKQEYSFHALDKERVVCRSLTMTFSFPNNNRTFTEDVTFTFNADKKIECVAFGLGAEARKDILTRGKNAKWNESAMLAIIQFLENYKTAFALKRLDYIKSIFDDNALIIVGHVVKRVAQQPSDGSSNYISNDIIKYNRYTKDQYIKNLERCFNSNQFVNIRFTDNDVVYADKGGEVYGVLIHQDYYSSTYGDTGYLFLLVDINNPEQPIIKVRTWQPTRTHGINNLSIDNEWYGVYGPWNF